MTQDQKEHLIDLITTLQTSCIAYGQAKRDLDINPNLSPTFRDHLSQKWNNAEITVREYINSL